MRSGDVVFYGALFGTYYSVHDYHDNYNNYYDHNHHHQYDNDYHNDWWFRIERCLLYRRYLLPWLLVRKLFRVGRYLPRQRHRLRYGAMRRTRVVPKN